MLPAAKERAMPAESIFFLGLVVCALILFTAALGFADRQTKDTL
jgi:hypothetical protein